MTKKISKPSRSGTSKRARRRNSALANELKSISFDLEAQQAGPTRKTWNIRDVKKIAPKNETQRAAMVSFLESNSHLIMHGSAGTGKTFIALYLALQDILDPNCECKHIKIVRSIASTRDIGFLPGTIEEKILPYQSPYVDILTDLIGRKSTYEDMKAAGYISFEPTSFVRGNTWDNTIVIMDEMQNMTFHEINSVVTRLGVNSRLIGVGDTKQTDLTKKNDVSGFADFLNVADRVSSTSKTSQIAVYRFTPQDIVRSGFVRSWLMACEELNL